MRDIAVLTLAVSCFASVAHAASPEELVDLKFSRACFAEMTNLDKVVEARDKGVTKAQIVEFAKTVPPQDAIPRESIDDVFAHSEITRDALFIYWIWACHARTNGVTPASLSKVGNRLQECAKSKGDSTCTESIRNQVYGLRRAIVRKVPPPLPVPPAPSR